MKNIEYKIGKISETPEIIEVYRNSGINRPIAAIERIAKMYAHSNLILTAWVDNNLIGVSRSLTDFCYVCYLSDLAIKKEYQKEGIGKKLIELSMKKIGKETTLILLSAPIAMQYYPKIGFSKINNGFIIPRTELK